MFLSKIWFFLVAAAAATALTVALLLPRPAQRQQQAGERQRITTACSVVNILLQTNARYRIDLAGTFARIDQTDAGLNLGGALNAAKGKKEISDELYKRGRTVASKLMDLTKTGKPTFIILVNRGGRVVARLGIDDKTRGDVLAGYHLVDDALDGYIRDDLWLIGDQMYLVAASSVVHRGSYAGAVVIGHRMNKEFAEQFGKQLGVDINFYAGGELIAASSTASIHQKVLGEYARLSGSETPLEKDCETFESFVVEAGSDNYMALLARLPGSAGERGAFFSVFFQRPAALGVMGVLNTVKQEDMSFGSFPWVSLAIGFLFIVGVGLGLMIFEIDLPLRKLANASVTLAKGENERFDEEGHRGKFGSVARSVNIRLDKMEREAKAKKTDLDDLLGGSSASVLPAAGPSGMNRPAKPPPPSEFKFTGGNQPRAATPTPPPRPATAPPRAATPPPVVPGRAGTPPPVPPGGSASGPVPEPKQPDAEPAEIVSAELEPAEAVSESAADSGDDEDLETRFRAVFQKFVQTKKECGESTSNLTYEKFAAKLRKNRQTLMAKHNCKAVKFQVYVKDGKAALKATPVKD